MRTWRAVVPFTAVAASAALLLGGCGGGSDADKAADNSKLTVWMMGDGSAAQTAFLDGVEAEFRQKHPGTDVVVQYIPWLEAPKKFQAALAGGDGPDVTELGNTETQGWAAQDALADLTARMAGWPEGKDILPDLVKNAQLDGAQYGVPWYAGVRAMYYRTDWFAEAGVKPPTSWDELVAAAKAVQAKKPGTYGIALPGNSELPFYSILWSAGGEIATRDGDAWKSGYTSAEARRAVSFWTELVTRHKVAPPAAAGWNEIDARTQFATGRAAMAFAGSWQQGAIKKDNPDIEKVWGTFPIPGPDGKPAPAFAGGSDLAIWKDSKRQELAWDYLTVLLKKENDQKFADNLGFFPVYSDLVGGSRYRDDKIMAAFASTMQNTRLTPVTPKWVEVSRTRTVTQTMNSAVMKGQKTVDQATAEAASEMESILNAK
ncbi:carbohydrate ABC transporter substrate-binding protein, CUT1 family [Micromonospora pattaloongensis]|uniref:Carbohydrate ABC transporter substrate-binding protein, CUT1 family n=1 Tax=Micromonospora pattaloongensis TaxID=405436 RepID=A0A1H3RKG5_9ACTN|nr:sugar ABC transporter substrate-binding protein [Micromonospora pattaloongensis]SDZ26232.1 carbohydrate ABC transporter substrate-binding protein, CUT1 family [Micromonospora pattaloongensis]